VVLAGVVNFAGLMLLYRAFEIGALSIVSPIASGFSVVAAGLAFLSGERLPAIALLGAALLVVGVVAVARGSGSDGGSTLRGVPEALGAAVALGVDFWLIVRTVPDLGWLWPALLSRAVQLACALGLARVAMRRTVRSGDAASLRRPLTRIALPALIGAGVLDSTGLVAFNLGVERAYTTTTAALTSLYAAVSVVLAWLFLTERLARWQWIGVGVILCGMLLVSI
ncbi:MAG: EamA family transporter, partial [Thermomicrobiales bacterium]